MIDVLLDLYEPVPISYPVIHSIYFIINIKM